MTSSFPRQPAEVVIVGRSRMNENPWCFEAHILSNWKPIRLIYKDDTIGWPRNAPFTVGQVWAITGRRIKNPSKSHIEDVIVESYEYVRDYGPALPEDILQNVPVARGGTKSLYGGNLERIASGSMKLNYGPPCRSQYWIPPYELGFDGKFYTFGDRAIPYVGDQKPEHIPEGSLVRLSLSNWFTAFGKTDPGFFLLLTGWWNPPPGKESW